MVVFPVSAPACEVTAGISLWRHKGQIQESREEASTGFSQRQLSTVCVYVGYGSPPFLSLTYDSSSPPSPLLFSLLSSLLLHLSGLMLANSYPDLDFRLPPFTAPVISLPSVLTTKPICNNIIQTVTD